jgi:hypothetical protein
MSTNKNDKTKADTSPSNTAQSPRKKAGLPSEIPDFPNSDPSPGPSPSGNKVH